MNRGINLALIFFFILNRNGLVLSKQLPTYLRDLRCPKTKEFDACFIENGHKAIPLVARGDPEYGIPRMIPLKIPFIRFVSTPSLTVNMTNVEVHGLDKMKITQHKSDMEKGLYIGSMKGENITLIGDYEAKGHILIMPLNGKGKFSMYLKNGVYQTVNSGKVVKTKGIEYFQMTDSRFSAKFEKIIFHLDNLFEGNKQLGDQVNDFLNENWETLVEDFGPSVGNTISKMINGIYNNFTSVVPANALFL